MTTIVTNYDTKKTIVMGVASLATSATFLAGRESTQVDNTSDRYLDVLIQGKVTVGTTPTIDTQVKIFLFGSDVSLVTTNLDVLDGVDSAETITSTGILNSLLANAVTIDVDSTTSDRTYNFKPFTIKDFFSEVPKFWGLFTAHNTGVNLNSTAGNHEFTYTGINQDIIV